MRQTMSDAELLHLEEGTVRADAIEVAPGARPALGAGAQAIQDLKDRLVATPIGAAVVRLVPSPALAVVLGAYILAAMVIPTMAPVSISDDWTYVRSVEILHRTGELE